MQKRAADEPAHEAEPAAQETARKEALRVVERWNAERPPLWSPTIRCAITAGMPWLDVYCAGCRTNDIRTLDRHPLASVGSLVLGFRCLWCPGSAPMPVLDGSHAASPAARWSKRIPVEFLHGRPLSPEELEMLRQQIEEGFDNIAEVDPEIRGNRRSQLASLARKASATKRLTGSKWSNPRQRWSLLRQTQGIRRSTRSPSGGRAAQTKRLQNSLNSMCHQPMPKYRENTACGNIKLEGVPSQFPCIDRTSTWRIQNEEKLMS